MKFSKKSSDKDSVISRLELENSRLKEEVHYYLISYENK